MKNEKFIVKTTSRSEKDEKKNSFYVVELESRNGFRSLLYPKKNKPKNIFYETSERKASPERN